MTLHFIFDSCPSTCYKPHEKPQHFEDIQ